MNKSLLVVHSFLALGVVVLVTAVAIREVLVDESYQPMSLQLFADPLRIYHSLQSDAAPVVTGPTDSSESMPATISAKFARTLLPEQLSSALYDSKTKQVTFLDCSRACEAVIYATETQKELRRIPLFTDASKEAALQTTELMFSDPTHELLAYIAPRNELYVINYTLELLQTIRLENERDTVEFIGYFPDTQQMAFLLHEKSGAYKELVLYSANKPSLHILKKLDSDTVVTVHPKSNAFTIDAEIIDLAGEIVFK